MTHSILETGVCLSSRRRSYHDAKAKAMYVQILKVFSTFPASWGIPEPGKSFSTACMGVGRRPRRLLFLIGLSGTGPAAARAEMEMVANIVVSFMLSCLLELLWN